MSGEPRTYRFGTLERNGFVGGLRLAQLVHLALCTFLAFLGFLAFGASHPGMAILGALLLAVIAALGAFAPIGGQPAADWVPVVARYLLRGKGDRRWASPLATAGELSRDLMRWIYRTLEKECDWQNADEQVDENIRCNEYEFDVDGERI